MSHYDFTNIKSEFYFSVMEWHKILELAQKFGWKPKGTSSNRIMKSFAGNWDNWDGNYFSFANQLVDEDDAKNLADALKRAIKDIPNVRPNISTDKMSLLELWSGRKFKKHLRKFITFCEEGIFIIY
jgi:hypothetical protein